MRFYADGPNIPDSLLELRDQGKVVFFCGAGVSKNEGLDSFEELTQAVMNYFDPPENFDSYESFYHEGDVRKPLVFDQVFYFLHEEFGRDEVNRVVAERLASTPSTISKSHQAILRISSDLDGKPQVVTTNFDHLFEPPLSSDIPIYAAPSLPNLNLTGSVSGITYLHGKLKSPEDSDHNYVLSSADFGRAYLSQAWATEFVQSLLANYTVVLLGYQAEDAPIKYLLQGLKHQSSNKEHLIYAFDVAETGDTESKWHDKGVIPIVSNDYPELWNSIEAWAERADDSRLWRAETLKLATKKPQDLQAFERGKIAHIIRTTAGAKAFSNQKPTPDPEWLCVFDPKCRIASVAKNLTEGTTFDPVKAYGLDDDLSIKEATESNIDKNTLNNLLNWNSSDTKNTRPLNLINTRQDMPNRLFELAKWITHTIDSPITVWWVLKQDRLHSRLLEMLIWAVNRNDALDSNAKRFWNLAFTFHKRQYFINSEIDSKFDLLDRMKNDDWSDAILREFETLTTPYISIEQPIIGLGREKPPSDSWENISPYDLAGWKIKGFDIGADAFDIPEKVLPKVFRILETQLIKQNSLRNAAPEFRLGSPTCYKSREIKGRRYEGDELFNLFLTVFQQLIETNTPLAKSHAFIWQTDHSESFQLLKLFAMNQETLFSPDEVFDYLMTLDNQEFWDSHVCRELLFLIMDRYSELSQSQQKDLIGRLLDGPEIDPEEGITQKETTRTTCRYIRRLQIGGVKILPVQNTKFKKLSNTLPDWSDEWAEHLTAINNGGSYNISTDESAKLIENLPIRTIADTAISLQDRQGGERTEKKPFIGLVKESPKKALLALGVKQRKDEYPYELWEQLIENIPVDLTPRYMQFFLARVSNLPSSVLNNLSYSLVKWMKEQVSFLVNNHTELFWYLVDQIIDSIRYQEASETPYESATYIPISNFSGGILTEVFLKLIDSLHLDPSQRIPDNIKLRLNGLLHLPPVISNRVICEITENLYWISNIDPEWVHQYIVSYFQLNEPQAPAAWKGYLRSNKLRLNEACSQKIYPLITTLFPKIYEKEWDEYLPENAAVILVQLTLNGSEEDWKVPFDDMRHCLRRMSVGNIQDVISRLAYIGQDAPLNWESKIIPFIEQAWPKEKSLQNPELTTSWLALLEDSGDSFPNTLHAVKPFLTAIQSPAHLYSFYRSSDEAPLAQLFPKDTLDLLDKIISNSPDAMHHSIPEMLSIIVESELVLLSDAKYKRLIAIVENG